MLQILQGNSFAFGHLSMLILDRLAYIYFWNTVMEQSRHSFTCRLLYTCISSKLFDGENTLRDLNIAWAKQMEELFYTGIEDWEVPKTSHAALSFIKLALFLWHHPATAAKAPCKGKWSHLPPDLDCHKRRLAIFKERTSAVYYVRDCIQKNWTSRIYLSSSLGLLLIYRIHQC